MQKFLLLFSFLTAAIPLFAQTAPIACNGRTATVRISEIKPGGSVEGFLAAAAAHKAWYAAHGVTGDQIFVSRVVLRDEKTRAQSYSDRQFMTFHIHAPMTGETPQPGPKHDDDYEAFVKQYRDNSDIKSEWNVCMPNLKQSSLIILCALG